LQFRDFFSLVLMFGFFFIIIIYVVKRCASCKINQLGAILNFDATAYEMIIDLIKYSLVAALILVVMMSP
jgi:hypothetical protein